MLIGIFVNKPLMKRGKKFLKLIEDIKNISKLVFNEVDSNQWEFFFKEIGDLDHVRMIEFKNCSVTNFFKYANQIKGVEDIRIIHYTEEEGKFDTQKIDEGVYMMTKLKSLDLSSDFKYVLPNTLTKVSNLQTLCISINQTIPKIIYELNQLKHLRLHISKQSDIDRISLFSNIYNLSKLETLFYDDQFLIELPEINLNKSIKKLSFLINNIKREPLFLKEMKELKYLWIDISHSIPEWITELTKLETVKFETLKDGVFPFFIKKLPNLKCIDITGCLEIVMNEEIKIKLREEFSNYSIIGID